MIPRPEELSALLAAVGACPAHADLIHTLAWTGLREGEALGLQWGDMDFRGGFLLCRRSAYYRRKRLYVKAPKSGKGRRVDIPAALAVRLKARRAVMEAEAAGHGREPSPWIFPDPANHAKPLDVHRFRMDVWHPLLKAVGLRAVRIHDLRHGYASLLLQRGASLTYVKDQLGHSTIKLTVDLYGHLVPGANRGVVEELAALTAPGDPASENTPAGVAAGLIDRAAKLPQAAAASWSLAGVLVARRAPD